MISGVSTHSAKGENQVCTNPESSLQQESAPPNPKIGSVAQKALSEISDSPNVVEKKGFAVKRPRSPSPELSEEGVDDLQQHSSDEEPRQVCKRRKVTTQKPKQAKLLTTSDTSTTLSHCKRKKPENIAEQDALDDSPDEAPSLKKKKLDPSLILPPLEQKFLENPSLLDKMEIRSLAECKKVTERVTKEICKAISRLLNIFMRPAFKIYYSTLLVSNINKTTSYQELAVLVEWYHKYILDNSRGKDKEVVSKVTVLNTHLINKIRSLE